jgi:SAM-dependent methyltransferase
MLNPGQRVHELGICLIVSLADCDSVIELGCGMGDKLAATYCKQRTGVDAHQPYIDLAKKRWEGKGIEFICGEATATLPQLPPTDAIIMIDFLEHLLKPEALELLEVCKLLARRRIIAFGPLGTVPQSIDSFHLGGDYWQTHRSTWEFSDFKERGFDVAVWNNYTGTYYYATWEPLL